MGAGIQEYDRVDLSAVEGRQEPSTVGIRAELYLEVGVPFAQFVEDRGEKFVRDRGLRSNLRQLGQTWHDASARLWSSSATNANTGPRIRRTADPNRSDRIASRRRSVSGDRHSPAHRRTTPAVVESGC